ncbi:PI-PLC X domain-containing protein 1 [Takifugu rubripes]|uniref:Si:dkey-66a8.7 n=1 Tax=Takifugu rubripes TaxID=31033 RepID=A0A674PMY9_TAKRU|nr:PI-PLC X domain-containing protein 1-like [Takifugu rubripes]
MEVNGEDWMAALPEELWDVPLTHLAIPGSHDAMSYCLDINSPLVESESDSFRLLDRLCCCFTRPTIFKWATTQDKSIEEQLSVGIRFFDLRVAHKPKDSSSDLYFTHVIYTHLTVVEVLLCVATWLRSHPKEIVILACSHFEGMNERLHQSFIFSLKRMFGSKLCPKTESNLTLRHLWASGYQVILSYESQEALEYKELWPEIPYWWANKRTADGVMSYMDCKKHSGRPEGFFVCGLNLTADRCFITKNSKQSLRTLTFTNWKCLSEWLEEQNPGGGHESLNIIAGDFVGPLPLCSLVIALNLKLLRKNIVN